MLKRNIIVLTILIVIAALSTCTIDGDIEALRVMAVEQESGMVWIKPGTFMMGSPEDEPGRVSWSGETQHEVTLTQGFYMGKYPVTQAQYKEIMGNIGHVYSGGGAGDKYPMYFVNWYYAIVFCNKLSISEGLSPAYKIGSSTDPSSWGDVPYDDKYPDVLKRWDAVQIVDGSTGYRLPTEAQWEYACRAGTTTAFNWGTNYIDSSKANYNASTLDENNLQGGANLKMKTEVGKYAPNAWGLYDMHGNVDEWCWDWLSSSYYEEGAQTDPTGPATGSLRVQRGGSSESSGQYLRSAYRSRNLVGPYGQYVYTGFRVVRPGSE